MEVIQGPLGWLRQALPTAFNVVIEKQNAPRGVLCFLEESFIECLQGLPFLRS